ncbi:hypothetical protein GCM10009800_23200 [Nocardiopsis rhodophaea]
MFPYVFLDATYRKARSQHRIASAAVVIATGVTAEGRREVLGFAAGDSESWAFWAEFLRELRSRGLDGVRLVVSDSHAALEEDLVHQPLGAAEPGGQTPGRCGAGLPGPPGVAPVGRGGAGRDA